jgi:crotonobetainyl-CoA:carnitine CoA-transferase CaiB-like acyl-CoA transferase
MVTPPAAKPLAGIRVLDLTRFVSGAYCTMVLDALGADVIKVEGLPGGDPYRAQGAVRVGSLSGLFASLNTGKRSIAVNLTNWSPPWPGAATCSWRTPGPGRWTGPGSARTGCTR